MYILHYLVPIFFIRHVVWKAAEHRLFFKYSCSDYAEVKPSSTGLRVWCLEAVTSNL
jgi:hypothetical protein